MRAANEVSEVVLEEPTNILLVERDSLSSFFEENSLPDNTNSFLATYNKTQKTYSFNNISSLVNSMYNKKGKSENWNKVVLIPVQVTTSSTSSSSTITSIANEMNINSVRLVGGSANKHTPIRISVIYNTNQ